MIIINVKNGLDKEIDLEAYCAEDLNKIYKFYSEHETFDVITEGK